MVSDFARGRHESCCDTSRGFTMVSAGSGGLHLQRPHIAEGSSDFSSQGADELQAPEGLDILQSRRAAWRRACVQSMFM
eukprot:603187-Alexandrium_andersonii.AAC.1